MKYYSFCAMALFGLGSVAGAASIYETSFEKERVGAAKMAGAKSNVAWVAKGSSITGRIAKSGKQSLQVSGGSQEILFALRGDAKNAKAISFFVKRGDNDGKLLFKVEATVGGVVRPMGDVGALIDPEEGFENEIKLPIPEGRDVTMVKFTVSSPARAGVLVDDVAVLDEVPYDITEIPFKLVIPTEPLKLMSSKTVFKAGDNKTHTFRIPSIITAANGDLIAACDARRNNAGDLVHF